MAIMHQQDINGMVGNIIVYTVNGEKRLRAKPRKYKNSKKDKNTTKIFGLVASCSAPMIRSLKNYFPGLIDETNRGKFIGWIRKQYEQYGSVKEWSLGIQLMPWYNLNREMDLRDYLLVQPQMEFQKNLQQLTVNFPALQCGRELIVPVTAATITISVVCISTAFQLPATEALQAVMLKTFDCTQKTIPACSLEMQLAAKENDVLMVLIGLSFSKNDRTINNKNTDFPVAVVGMGRV